MNNYFDRFNMIKESNIFLAKRNIIDLIWKSCHIEGINITFSETQRIYNGGNKRTSMLLANKILISNGKGILNVPIELDIKFGELLINYYETNDMEKIKRFFYDNCLDGIN